MTGRLPLPTLLSFALVAFTIEFDNEVEHRLPHRTTDLGGARPAVWLVSLAMYLNCLQFVPEQGITARELERQARTRPNWDGMRRWRYLQLEPAPDDARPRPPRSAWLVRATPQGRLARETMRALLPAIERRWVERFGRAAIGELRRDLISIVRTLPAWFPDCMPILGFGLSCRDRVAKGRAAEEPPSDMEGLPLPVLLARFLLAWALEFERESPVSLAICANALRVLPEEGILSREIPARSGVSKEGLRMAMTFLSKRGFVRVVSQKPAQRGRIILLTEKGAQVQAEYPRQLQFLEGRWRQRIDASVLDRLRRSLEALAGDGTRPHSPLFQGLEPYPDSWRAQMAPPSTLPHFPLVLHRGGYPDGS